MSETSTVPSFQDQFITTLAANAAFAGVPIVVGSPVGEWPRDTVFLGDVDTEESSREWGNQSRDEFYNQTVYLSSVREGTSNTDARDVVYALRDAIASELKSDPTMGGTVIWALMQGGPLSLKANATRREAELRITIRCRAKI